jgi:hypothetical protein
LSDKEFIIQWQDILGGLHTEHQTAENKFQAIDVFCAGTPLLATIVTIKEVIR